MNNVAWALLVAAAVVAIIDWIAVARRPSRVETIAKPLVLVLLVVAAIVLDPVDGARRAWFVAALVLSLAGDVFLLPRPDKFVAGLASFLLAHLAYVAGFVAGGIVLAATPVAIVLVCLVGIPLGRRLVAGARASGHADVVVPVIAYVAVIALMVVAALASGNRVAAVGALSFMASDALIGWTRFVRPIAWAPVGIMVTYHVAQVLLVVSLTVEAFKVTIPVG